VGAEALEGDQRAEEHEAGAEQLPVAGWVPETDAQRGDPSLPLVPGVVPGVLVGGPGPVLVFPG
jgi:hypothetical protein